jgi:hypothetical protein
MALFDNNPLYENISSLANPITSGIGGLFKGMTPFGSSIPEGILTSDQEQKLRNQALFQGLLGTAATYLATPKNLNAGSPLPYLGKAFLGGMGASQDVIDRGLNNVYRQKILAGKEDNIRTYESDRKKITEIYDPITKETKRYESPLDAPVTEKPEGFTDTYKNVAIELFGTANPSQLTEQQRKQLGAEIKARAIANKPETKIVMPAGQTKYEERLGTIRAEQDVELVNTANKSKNNISKIDMTLNQIQNSDVITGFGADIQKNVNRFAAKVLKDKKAGKQVADTEILDAFLGSDVFPQIGALGIGAKGLDTPAEREFMRQVLTGTISLDKNTLIKMTQTRRDIEKRAIDRYNQALQSGELDDYFTSTKRQKKLIDIPDNSGFRIVP